MPPVRTKKHAPTSGPEDAPLPGILDPPPPRPAMADLAPDLPAEPEPEPEPESGNLFPDAPRKRRRKRRADAGRPRAVEPDDDDDDVPAVPDAVVHAIYHGLGIILGMVAARMRPDVPAHVRAEIAGFSREELDAVTPPTALVLAKYGASLLSKWGDEAALALVLVSVLGAKQARLMAAPTGPAPGTFARTDGPVQ